MLPAPGTPSRRPSVLNSKLFNKDLHEWFLTFPISAENQQLSSSKKLDWASLKKQKSHRRICLFKAMNFSEMKAPLSDMLVPNNQTGTRRNNLQYNIEHHKTKAHMSTFFICTSKYWNTLGPTGQTPLLVWLVHCARPLDHRNQTRNEIQT